jgi:hypothetical protein
VSQVSTAAFQTSTQTTLEEILKRLPALDSPPVDLVLGVDWLRLLGPILWDFVELTMKFQQGKKEVQLQGMRPTESTIEEAKSICKNRGSTCKGVWVQLVIAGDPKKPTNAHPAIWFSLMRAKR